MLCAVPCLPQAHDESDEDVALRLKAQKAAPHTMLWPYHPQLESHELFTKRCHDATGARKEKRKSVTIINRMSRAKSGGSSGRKSFHDEDENGKKKRRSSLLGTLSQHVSKMRSSSMSSDGGQGRAPGVARVGPPGPTEA